MKTETVSLKWIKNRKGELPPQYNVILRFKMTDLKLRRIVTITQVLGNIISQKGKQKPYKILFGALQVFSNASHQKKFKNHCSNPLDLAV